MSDHGDFGSQLLAQASTVRSIGARRRRDRADLDDFTQEVFLRAFANHDPLRDADRLPQWVAAIARNAATAANARERGVPDVVLDMLPGWRPTPHAHAESAERWRDLVHALDSLDEEDREILRARYPSHSESVPMDASRVPQRPPQPNERTLALWDFSEGPDADECHDVSGHGYVIRAVVAE